MQKKRISLRLKLIISYSLFVLLIVVIGLMAIWNMKRIFDNSNAIYKNNLQSINILRTVNQNVKEINLCISNAFENTDYPVTEEIEDFQSQNQSLLTSYEKMDTTAMERRRYKQCRLSIQTFDKQIDSITVALKKGDTETARQMYTQELAPVRACTYELLDAIVELSEKNAEAKYLDNKEMYRNIIYTVVTLVILSLLLAIVITVYVNGMLKRRLTSIGLLAERLSEYDLSEDIGDIVQDEFGKITESLNNAQLMLRNLITKISEESEDMAAIGSDLSGAVNKIGSRIENINLIIYDTETEIEKIEKKCGDLMTHSEGEERVNVTKMMNICAEQRKILENIQSDLTGVISYVSQINIIVSQQNDISALHKVQMGKFKIK